MTQLARLWRSPVWRAAAIAGAVVIAGAGWYLGSPLFITTTVHEDLPAATAAARTAGATGAASTAAQATTGTQPTGPVLLAEGQLQFVDNLHNGKGPVRIARIGEQRFVRFEEVTITNAPDVHVYLSRETGGKWSESTSLYLGALKATNGSFNYDIPASADLSLYKSVVVWCRAFSVLVTWADLKPV